jgi:hypothetical protein
MFKKKITLFVLCLAIAAGLSAQAVANAVLNKTMVETGDTFTLRILVHNAPAEPLKVNFAAWAPFITTENILAESKWSRTGRRWQREYTLLVFDSAQLSLPSLDVILRNGEKILTNSVQLTVSPTPAGTEVSDAETIRDIVREPTLWTDYWPWAAGALAAMFLLYFFRKKKPQPMPVAVAAPPPPQAPPHEITLQQLAALEQQKPWKNGRTDQFYAELSMILRTYLERRFQIPALESTTREILPLLKTTDFPDQQSKTLQEVLYQSDMAKFAQQPPSEQAHEKNLHNARKVVMASSGMANSTTVPQNKPYSNL